MHTVYSGQTSDYEPGLHYRNADYFAKPDRRTTSVTVVGYYPHIVEAYQARGVPVNVVSPGAPLRAPGQLEGPAANGDPHNDGDTVEIPNGWESLHWMKLEKLALEIVGGDGPLVTEENQSRGEKAKAIIAAEMASREDN